MKPILFSTPMVQAILAGNKTQTRRVMKPQPPTGAAFNTTYVDGTTEFKCLLQPDPLCDYAKYFKTKARHQPGDILWVRETWAKFSDWADVDESVGCPDGFLYRADWPDDAEHPKWRPSIHMPRAAARIFLRVTDVRLERVQEISEEDAIAEGFGSGKCEPRQCDACIYGYGCPGYCAKESFAYLWESLNRKRGFSWNINPWVWVCTFEPITEDEARKEPSHDRQ